MTSEKEKGRKKSQKKRKRPTVNRPASAKTFEENEFFEESRIRSWQPLVLPDGAPVVTSIPPPPPDPPLLEQPRQCSHSRSHASSHGTAHSISDSFALHHGHSSVDLSVGPAVEEPEQPASSSHRTKLLKHRSCAALPGLHPAMGHPVMKPHKSIGHRHENEDGHVAGLSMADYAANYNLSDPAVQKLKHLQVECF